MIYKEAIVTYLDILGFKKRIEESKEHPELIANIYHDLEKLKDGASIFLGAVQNEMKPRNRRVFYAYNFSDMTVRCTLSQGKDLTYSLYSELISVGLMQMGFFCENVLLRGGICRDDILTNSKNQIVFGPALVKSYQLENQWAVYPRIVIDRHLIFKAEDQPGEKYWKPFVGQGDDGTHFVDYLFGTAMLRGFEGQYGSPVVLFEKHRKVILDNIRLNNRPEERRKLL